MGLAAIRGYDREAERRVDLDRETKRFGWLEDEMQSRERVRASAEGADITGNDLQAASNLAGLESLPDATDAARTSNQLTAARNRAGLDSLPGEEAIKDKRNSLESLSLDGQMEAQPNLNKAAAINAETGVKSATGARDRQGLDNETLFNQSSVAKLVSELSVEQAPAKIAEMRRNQVISEAEAGTVALYHLGQLIDQGDPAKVVQFMNNMNKADPSMGQGADVANVTFVTDDNGESTFVATGADGSEVMRLTKSQMDAINQRIAPPQQSTVSPGQTIIQTGRDGAITPVYTAPDRATTLPAEARLVEYYVSKGMSEEQALSRASTLKNMSPDNAAFELYKDRVAMSPNMTQENRTAAMDEVRKEVAMIFNLEELPELSEPTGEDAAAAASDVNWAEWVQ
jgi:hypothetical protein